MTYCPKCEKTLFPSIVLKWCPVHQKEYYEWLNDDTYTPCNCKCGSKDWKNGELQVTDPPSFPLMKVFRCVKCDDIKLEQSTSTDSIRIVVRED